MTENFQKASVDAVLAEFDGKKDLYALLCIRTKNLIEELLQDAGIAYQSVQARVKRRDKLKQKYLDPSKQYQQLNDITDQAALRVVVFYEDEVDPVAEVIKREFEVDVDRSVDKRETEPDKFGYYALNYVCRYGDGRAKQVEYKKLAGIWFEVQIVSILRHAWSEIEHPWYDLKQAVPDTIRRRFARMAALLEIAESEFLSLKNTLSEYQQAVNVQVEAKVPGVPVDAVSLRSFVEQEPLVRALDSALAEVTKRTLVPQLSDSMSQRWSALARQAGLMTVADLSEALNDYKDAIPEFLARCLQELYPVQKRVGVLNKGASVFQLLVLRAMIQGKETAGRFWEANGVKVLWDLDRQVQIAKEVIAKHSR